MAETTDMMMTDDESRSAPEVPAEAPVAPAPEAVVPKPATQPKPRASRAAKPETYWATGRRKEAVARVRLIPGSGKIVVNHRQYEDYFPREIWRLSIRQPLLVAQQLGKYDVLVNVDGGGATGQSGAIRLGIARALLKFDESLRKTLRSAGLLTRDPRAKERKKYGLKGAHKRFQWTKR